MKWFREIQAVGIRDWLWFVVYLRRNEFSNKLCILRYYPKKMDQMMIARTRAHRIDSLLNAS